MLCHDIITGFVVVKKPHCVIAIPTITTEHY